MGTFHLIVAFILFFSSMAAFITYIKKVDDSLDFADFNILTLGIIVLSFSWPITVPIIFFIGIMYILYQYVVKENNLIFKGFKVITDWYKT